LATLHIANNVLQLDFLPFILISISEITSAEAATTAKFRVNFCVLMSHNSQYVEVFNEKSNFVNRQLYTLGMGINSMRIRLQHPDKTFVGLNSGYWRMPGCWLQVKKKQPYHLHTPLFFVFLL
jgi:hypothetical protein